MNVEVKKYLAFVLVGFVAALVSTAIDSSLAEGRGEPKTELVILLILISVFVVGYAGTYVAEYLGANVVEMGGRWKIYVKSLYIYLITWFVVYTLLYNAFIFPG